MKEEVNVVPISHGPKTTSFMSCSWKRRSRVARKLIDGDVLKIIHFFGFKVDGWMDGWMDR